MANLLITENTTDAPAAYIHYIDERGEEATFIAILIEDVIMNIAKIDARGCKIVSVQLVGSSITLGITF